MKVRIISLFLSLAFLSILTFEYISSTMLLENSNTEAVEYVMEKRSTDKLIDDTNLLDSTLTSLDTVLKPLHTFDEVFYTFKITNNLFRPPITL